MDIVEVRSPGKNGKYLFAWDPRENTIDIIRKNMFYRVKLYDDKICGSYQILEQHPKKDLEIQK